MKTIVKWLDKENMRLMMPCMYRLVKTSALKTLTSQKSNPDRNSTRLRVVYAYTIITWVQHVSNKTVPLFVYLQHETTTWQKLSSNKHKMVITVANM